MRKRSRKYLPSRWIYILLFILFSMGVGYAALSTTLSINGTSDIDSSNWNIYFDNVQVTSGSVSATSPVITNNTTVTFSANLANPGDFYEFTVDVINGGTLNAEINSVEILPVLTPEQLEFFDYDVSYINDAPIEAGDILAESQTEIIKVRFGYKENSDVSLYPTDDTTFDYSISINYIQKPGFIQGKSITYKAKGENYINTSKAIYLMTTDGYIDEMHVNETRTIMSPSKVKIYTDSEEGYELVVNSTPLGENVFSSIVKIEDDIDIGLKYG